MKTFLLSGLALLAATTARAELFRPAFRGHGDYGRAVVHMGAPYRYGDWRFGYRVGFYETFPSYGYYDSYSGGSSYAADGLLLGTIAGAIIGNNSGEFRHNGWRGAAWGAGLGWLLGSIADANRARVAYAQSATVVATPAVQAVPMQTVAQPPAVAAPATPMSGANALFGR